MTVGDVEIDRVLNALATTFNDQHPSSLELARVEQIATGALGGERRIEARKAAEWRCTLHEADDGTTLATLERSPQGRWSTQRVAVPSP